MVTLKCFICFKPFIVGNYRQTSAKYCSSKCYGISKQGKPSALRGRNIPIEIRKKISSTLQGIEINQWNGFTKSEDKLQRRKFQDLIQKQVFKRDNYTCQLCGVRGGQLQVDHIQSWKDYIELRFSMDNCRTLCMKCHYLITFGKPKPKEVKTWGHNLVRRVIT